MTGSATVVFVSTPFPTLSLPFEMAGHQLYDMMHSLLQSIAAGAVSGSPGSGGPNLQLSPQMMQPMSLAPPTNPQTMPFAPFSMIPYGGLANFGKSMSLMPYGGLPNFGNATSGALMPHGSEQHAVFIARASAGTRSRCSCYDSCRRSPDQPTFHGRLPPVPLPQIPFLPQATPPLTLPHQPSPGTRRSLAKRHGHSQD